MGTKRKGAFLMTVTEETEQEVRELRARAEEYADRVAAGEEPWREDPNWEETPEVRNDDVGETGEPDDGDAITPPTYGDAGEDDGA